MDWYDNSFIVTELFPSEKNLGLAGQQSLNL